MVDLTRLCEVVELTSTLPARTVGRVITAFREHCLRYAHEKGDIQPASNSTLDGLKEITDFQWSFWESSGVTHIGEVLSSLVTTPRLLKHSLRRTWMEWRILHGEVDFDDLLVCNIVRVASAKSFDFLTDNRSTLADDKARVKKDKTNWSRVVTDCGTNVRQQLWEVLGFLLPGVDGGRTLRRSPQPPQGIRYERYWRRVNGGYIGADEIRDQTVLGEMAKWKAAREESRLSMELTQQEGFANVFEDMMQTSVSDELRLSASELLELAEVVFHIVLENQGSDANSDSVPGFISLWRCALQFAKRGALPEGYQDWLLKQIDVALRVSLQFANDLEYYWGSVSQGLLSPVSRDILRDCIVATAQSTLDGEHITKIVTLRHPWALRHFVTRSYDETPPTLDPSKWDWIAPRLSDAIQLDPMLAVPQVCFLFRGSNREIRIDPKTRQPRSSTGSLDRELVRTLVPETQIRRDLVATLIAAKIEADTYDAEIAETVRVVRSDAAAWEREGLS